MWVPQGFAHGYMTLTTHTLVQYYVDNFYMPEYETGIRYDSLGIKWPAKPLEISGKDKRWNKLEDGFKVSKTNSWFLS